MLQGLDVADHNSCSDVVQNMEVGMLGLSLLSPLYAVRYFNSGNDVTYF